MNKFARETTLQQGCGAGLMVLLLAGSPVAYSAEPAAKGNSAVDHSAHAHEMSAEDIATLRRKIDLYQEYTDEQINASMARMTDSQKYVSPAGVRGEVGVLALGHGYKEPGDTMFTNAYKPVAAEHPTAAALGMAMMSSSHIQQAVDQLEAAGAKTIVAIPTEIGDYTSLVRQWHYIFGLSDESAYLDVPRVKTNAKVVVTKTVVTDPVVGEILGDYAKAAARNPKKEVALIVAHGPELPADNVKLLEVLDRHAKQVKSASGLLEVKAESVQDDAPSEIRKANADRMRQWIKSHADNGHRVIVLQVLMTGQGGVTQRFRKDFAGLDFDLVDKGLVEHPAFGAWIEKQIAQATTGKSAGS